MKRFVLTLIGTVTGLVALLSFKSQTHPLTSAGALPAAGLQPSTTPATTSPAPSTRTRTKSTAPSAKHSSAPSAKAYLGAPITTQYGVVQVKVTVRGTTITNVAFAQLTAFDPHSQEINSFAGPQLLQETLSKQSAQVDTVSGATYTSDGYRQSLQSALDAAGVK